MRFSRGRPPGTPLYRALYVGSDIVDYDSNLKLHILNIFNAQ